MRGLASSADGETLFSGGYDGRLIWWPATAEKPEPIRVVEAHHGWIRAIAVSPDGKYVASCGNDRLVKVWDAAQGTLLQNLPAISRTSTTFSFHTIRPRSSRAI